MLLTMTYRQHSLQTSGLCLKKTKTRLEPLKEFNRKVSSATASAADVIPSVTLLKRVLAMETKADSGIKTMKKTLLEAIDKRFSTVENEPLYALSTLLDPRYKDRFFTSAESAKHGKDALAKELEEDLRTTTDDEASEILKPPEKASWAEAAAAPCRNKSSSSFMKEFEKFREEREEPGGAASCSILKYLCAPCTSVESERLFSTVSSILEEKRNS
ncbi:uncharacterized protein [Sinocyclocheilus grahami]|uniref:uncharacterized protein n=1 Tax=Sinocyclocheilus grahami TaxID=75366 RepID=UPI0007AD152E|nr:PREDICTED: uncharacterized protein LOC107565349 [Sinocyclocheilus grahami]